MPKRTKMIGGKRYYYLGTYSKKPKAEAIQRTGASVYERRHYKSFKHVERYHSNGELKQNTYYQVYYRDVKDPRKYREHKKVGRYAYSERKNRAYNKAYGPRKLFDLRIK